MVNMTSNTTTGKSDLSSAGGKASSFWRWAIFPFLAIALLYAAPALAQDAAAATRGLCQFAGFLKQIATVAAIIAIVLFVLNSFFIKSSVVGDIIMYVIIGCVILVAAPYLIGLTGLTSNCAI